jgi:hypothetical protein
MDYQPTYAAPGPRASSYFAFKDSPAPPRPHGIPFPAAYDAFMECVLPSPLDDAILTSCRNSYRLPLFFGISYFIVAKTLSHYQNGKNRIQGRWWDVAVLAHNVFLAVYSAWTFVGTAPMIIGTFWRGWMVRLPSFAASLVPFRHLCPPNNDAERLPLSCATTFHSVRN